MFALTLWRRAILRCLLYWFPVWVSKGTKPPLHVGENASGIFSGTRKLTSEFGYLYARTGVQRRSLCKKQ